jgi:hypothetical protein
VIQPPSEPIIVSIEEPSAASQLETLGDILIGSLGLTGAIALASVVVGVALGSLMFWLRSRDR